MVAPLPATMLQILKNQAVTVLGAGPTELLTAGGVEVAGLERLSFILKNIGAAALTDLSVYWQDGPSGSDWSPADSRVYLPAGTLAPGDSVEITITELSSSRMRLTASGTAGQSVRLNLSAVWG